MSWNGLLLIDKPSGPTSHDVVHRVRNILGLSSVGHSGTLDPLASGLMVILLGQATKLSDYILSRDKTYEVTIRLGIKTDSGDRTGAVVKEKSVAVSDADVIEALKALTGDLTLRVPVYSAIKVKGKKLYEYARAEQEIAPPEKAMRFYDVQLEKVDLPLVKVTVSCSKGSYIRSWVEELGERLATGATVEELRRISSEPHHVHGAIGLEALSEIAKKDDVRQALGPAFIPMPDALPGMRSCCIKGREERLLRHGQISYDLANRLVLAQKQAHRDQAPVGIKVVGAGGELIGLLEALPQQGLKIRRIFAVDPESHNH